MSDGFMLYLDDNGVARAYDDTYDITIHCESEEEQQKAIEQLKSLQWIPCSERLPFAEFGESDYVLTTCGYRDVKDTSVRWIRLLYFNGGNWCYPTGETYEQKVYAWMPLPEPYGEEDYDHT